MKTITETEYNRQVRDALIKRAEEAGVEYRLGRYGDPEKIRQVANEIFAETLCILNKQDPEIEKNKNEWKFMLDSCETLGDLENAGLSGYLIYRYQQLLDELLYYELDDGDYEDDMLLGDIEIRCCKCGRHEIDCPMDKDEDCPYEEEPVLVTYNN